MRAAVVRRLAQLFADRRWERLKHKEGILRIHAVHKCATPKESLHQHISQRIEESYPEHLHSMPDGALVDGMQEIVVSQAQAERATQKVHESGFEMKQSTMPDVPESVENTFQNVRPTIVVAEATTESALPEELKSEYGLGRLARLDVPLQHKFEDQFISPYLPSIFPWALNYECGGPEYPDLFSDWSEIERTANSGNSAGMQQRWRRVQGEAILLPALYSEMLATRPEVQIAGDWMLVPGARNLQWSMRSYDLLSSIAKQSYL